MLIDPENWRLLEFDPTIEMHIVAADFDVGRLTYTERNEFKALLSGKKFEISQIKVLELRTDNWDNFRALFHAIVEVSL